MGAEAGMMWPQAKESAGPPELDTAQPHLHVGLTSASRTGEHTQLLFKPQFVIICYGSHRTLTQT